MLRSLTSIALLLTLTIPVTAQPPRYQRVADSSLVYKMNRIQVIGEAENINEGLSARALVISNPSGSADTVGEVGSDVVSHDLYIAVSEFGEHPDQALYRVPDLIAPELRRTDREEVAFYLRVGSVKTRRTLKIDPTLSTLELTEVEP